MTNLRKVGLYYIGLDIGTASVGWAVIDEQGNLCIFKKKPTWGSRLFPSADSAQKARIARGMRRRLDRRRQRLNLLQELFAEEMAKVDPEFFIRLNQARLLKEDRADEHNEYLWPLFNDSDFNEKDYYKRFPTIYHLRKYLLESNEKEDIRLIYLAFHNIVKCRGNFLHQENKNLSAKNANIESSVERLILAYEQWCTDNGISIVSNLNSTEVVSLLNDRKASAINKAKELAKLFAVEKQYEKVSKSLADLILGYSADPADIFLIDPYESKFKLSDDESLEKFRDKCPDEGTELLDSLYSLYSALILMDILRGATGKTLSYCKVNEYEQYKQDLLLLKKLVKKYCDKEQYKKMFRGETFSGEAEKPHPRAGEYIPSKAEGYTKYNLIRSQSIRDEFLKSIPEYFKNAETESDSEYKLMKKRIDDGVFLQRLKTSSNGVIPYQLHLEEMHAIIEKQAAFYPFLLESYNGKNKIESLVDFRIPYYVGPLTQKNAAKDVATDKLRFAWSERFEGKENEKVYPWNWDEIIDRDTSAERFIERMVGECTYLKGEQVLPRCSLTYELFCVLNELAGAKWSNDGKEYYRFSAGDRAALVDELFKRRKTVTYKAVAEWLKKRGHFGDIYVKGGQGETAFVSKLSSYKDFCDILGVDELSKQQEIMAEELVLWSTLFEDRDIYKRKIKAKYGDVLTAEQITKLARKRHAGWGNLSRKLLCELKAETYNGSMSVMELLAEGDVDSVKQYGSAITFMEIVTNERWGLQKKIEEHNTAQLAGMDKFDLNSLQGSPAKRRAVNQALRIVDEIVSIVGHEPAAIFIEETRDALDTRKKGKRTTARYNEIKNLLASIKKEEPGLLEDLNKCKPADLTEKLELYFIQRGKCMYSKRALDINQLSMYQVDHIIPQAYIKDDSIENKVLVYPEENQRKTDNLLLDASVRHKMCSFWESLHDAGFIGDKKHNNLLTSEISDRRLKGFIARQLVETSQIVKELRLILGEKYAETDIHPIKASLSSSLREKYDLVKCREINDYHHAHDAYLACTMGRFLLFRFDDYLENPIRAAYKMKALVRALSKEAQKNPDLKQRRNVYGSAGFFVESFNRSGFSEETGEIFTDTWNAPEEIARMRESLNSKHCFISRMPEETSGAFWDATIYSSYDTSKKLELPLKKGLDVAKYGSYSGKDYAYFFIYKVTNSKGKSKNYFDRVPLYIAPKIAKGEMTVLDYAIELVADPKSTVTVLKERILKYQLIAYGKDLYYLPALDCVYTAKQPTYSTTTINVIVQIIKEINDEKGVDYIELTDDVLNSTYEELAEKASTLCARFKTVQDQLINGLEKFQSLSIKDKKTQIMLLIPFYHGKKSRVDISLVKDEVKGGKNAGAIKNGFLTSELDKITFVDQSVTGMFERRYKLEL